MLVYTVILSMTLLELRAKSDGICGLMWLMLYSAEDVNWVRDGTLH